MADAYRDTRGSLDGPAVDAFTITRSDTTVFAQPTRALWVGTGGNVAVRMITGNTVTFANVPDGTLMPVRVDKVLSSGTTGSNIVGLV